VRLGWPIAALLGLVLPVKASAQLLPSPGPYLSIGGGALQTQTFSNGSVDASFQLGPSLEVAAGYSFGDFRADLSYVYGSAAAKNALIQLFGTTQNLATTGSIQTNSVFVNGYYYVPAKHKVRPYLGGGVGIRAWAAVWVLRDRGLTTIVRVPVTPLAIKRSLGWPTNPQLSLSCSQKASIAG
jgi:hypothetical protein